MNHYLRFDRYHRLLHGFLMVSFIGLAFTGMPLLFSEARWAPALSAVFGGPWSAGVIHRILAVVLIATFVLHVMRLLHRLFVLKDWRSSGAPRR
jgi:cytochrome b subunit of formate dehydrogenase